jgi:FlgD Ig-like domain
LTAAGGAPSKTTAARAGRSPRRAASDRARERLAASVFALLVIASFAAFGITQHLKHAPPPVVFETMLPSFSPNRGARHTEEVFDFKIAHADEVTVQIVDAAGGTIATVARDTPLPRYQRHKFTWNGRTSRGAHAPQGVYKVRVLLRNQKREVVLPRTFELVAFKRVAAKGGR